MLRVEDVMTTEVVTVEPTTPFPDVVAALVDHGISGVPVVEDGRVVGIVTESDLVAKEAYGGARRRALDLLKEIVHQDRPTPTVRSRGRNASGVMTPRPTCVAPTETLRSAARRMVDEGIKRLPVVEPGGRLVGIVSRSDVLGILHREDDVIELDVQRLLGDPLWVPEDLHVHAKVTDGVVHLSGTTRFPMDIPVVVAVAWKVAGVVDVETELGAREPDPTPIVY